MAKDGPANDFGGTGVGWPADFSAQADFGVDFSVLTHRRLKESIGRLPEDVHRLDFGTEQRGWDPVMD